MKTLLIRVVDHGPVALLLACFLAVASPARSLFAPPIPVCVPPSTTYVDDSWVGTSPGADPDGGGPATNFGCNSFATVQGGVSGVTTGGNVLVAAGTYLETQVLITKTLTVTGAGAATTIINGGGNAPPSGGLVRIEPPSGDTGNVGFSGFTITNPGTGGGTRTGMFVKPLDPATVVTISNNRIVGNNSSDYGLYAYRNRGSIVFTSNAITNTAFNGVLIEQPLNATNFSSNTITVAGVSTSYFAMTYDSENVTSLQRVANNTFNGANASAIIFNPSPSFVSSGSRLGKYTNVEITGNTITNLGVGRTGIGLLNDTSDTTGAAGAVENPTITGNKITGTGAATSNGIRLRGLVTNANISGNDIRNLARGFFGEVVNTHSATGTEVHFNNFVDNPTGFVWNGAAPIDAENNWWGCNGGPGATGCDPVGGTGAASVDYVPWIVLGVTASPNPIQPFGTSTVTADMTQNSAPGPAGGAIPAVTVIFSATEGTIPSPALTTGGTASSLFTSTSANNGVVCARVDHQTICTAFSIAADVGIDKSVTPTSQAPGLSITYVLSFSNAGPGVAQHVVISDTVPVSVTVSGITSSTVGNGVVITQTNGAPNFAWAVSDLAVGEGGVITITAVVSDNNALIGTQITNTATITASSDMTPTNNGSSAVLNVIELPGTIIVQKVVVGTPPASAWQFVGPTGAFTLPAVGGSAVFTPVAVGPYTISETPQANYTVNSACSSGATGGASVNLTLGSAQTITCTFTNTRQIATITIVKDAEPASPTNFRFTGSYQGGGSGSDSGASIADFYLDDASPDDGDAFGNSKSFTVPRGAVYSFGEPAVVGWHLMSITCNPAASATVNLATRGVTINTSSGYDVVCIFRNEQAAALTVRKYRESNGVAGQQAPEAFLSTWTIQVKSSPTGTLISQAATNALGKVSFSLKPGSYQVCEVMKSGWTQKVPVGNGCHALTLLPGSATQVDFGNCPNSSCPVMTAETGGADAPVAPVTFDVAADDLDGWVDQWLLTADGPTEETLEPDAEDAGLRVFLPVVVK